MCKVVASVVAADGKAIDAALISIANVEQPINPTVAADLLAAGTALVTATANWQTGSAVNDINTAAAAIEAILNVIPATAPYAVFVAIAVAALDILMANLGAQSALTGNYIKDARMVAKAIDNLPPNHWRGQAKIQHNGDLRKGFENTWNAEVDARPDIKGFSHITV